jgi:hypothetical protein
VEPPRGGELVSAYALGRLPLTACLAALVTLPACASPESDISLNAPRCDELKLGDPGALNAVRDLRGAWSLEVTRCLTPSDYISGEVMTWVSLTSAVFTLDRRGADLSADLTGASGEEPAESLTLSSALNTNSSELNTLCSSTDKPPSCLRLLYDHTAEGSRLELWLHVKSAQLVSAQLNEQRRYHTPYELEGVVYGELNASGALEQLGVFKLLPHPTESDAK